MKLLLLLTLSTIVAVSATAQNVTFRIGLGGLKDLNGVTIPKTTPGITVLASTASLSNLQSLSFSSDPNVFLEQLKGLATNPIFTNGWTNVPVSSGPPATVSDWTHTSTRTVGEHPIIFITTSPLNQLTLSDSVGFFYTSSPVFSPGTLTVSTDTFVNWDVAVIGSRGSLVLAPIPEPSTYAAIFGLLALGGVMIRRRIRK